MAPAPILTGSDSAFKQILIWCKYIDYSGNTAKYHKDDNWSLYLKQ